MCLLGSCPSDLGPLPETYARVGRGRRRRNYVFSRYTSLLGAEATSYKVFRKESAISQTRAGALVVYQHLIGAAWRPKQGTRHRQILCVAAAFAVSPELVEIPYAFRTRRIFPADSSRIITSRARSAINPIAMIILSPPCIKNRFFYYINSKK